MNKATKFVIAIVVVAVVAVGIILATGKKDNSSKAQPATTTSSSSQTATNNTASKPAAATITYDGSSFSPATITIKAGESVKIVNSSQDALSFDSDPHPTHTNEPELNADNVDPGKSTTITVTKQGTWGYHNHFNPSQKGTIVVQ